MVQTGDGAVSQVFDVETSTPTDTILLFGGHKTFGLASALSILIWQFSSCHLSPLTRIE